MDNASAIAAAQDMIAQSSASRKRLAIYGASDTSLAHQWDHLRKEWPEFHWTARWPDLVAAGIPETPQNSRLFWVRDFEDIAQADVVMVLRQGASRLRGALVEAGAGIALGKQVLVLNLGGEAAGSWSYHPQVTTVDSWDEARGWLRLMGAGPRAAGEQQELDLAGAKAPKWVGEAPYFDAPR